MGEPYSTSRGSGENESWCSHHLVVAKRQAPTLYVCCHRHDPVEYRKLSVELWRKIPPKPLQCHMKNKLYSTENNIFRIKTRIFTHTWTRDRLECDQKSIHLHSPPTFNVWTKHSAVLGRRRRSEKNDILFPDWLGGCYFHQWEVVKYTRALGKHSRCPHHVKLL